MTEFINLILLSITFVIFLFFCYAFWINKHFDRRSTKIYVKPIPIFGNLFNIFMNREHFTKVLTSIYKKSEGDRYTGFFAFLTPIVILKDLELIKRIAVKDFEYFLDHKVFTDDEAEPLFGNNLFFLKGQKWRDMRATLSPAFTGSKMKAMLPLIYECAEQFRDFLYKETEGANDEIIELEIKEVVTRYTNDVIASTAFGFKINSFEDRYNEFYAMGKRATNFSGIQFIIFQLYAFIPNIMKKLKIKLFPKRVNNYYRNIVSEAIQHREKYGIIRPDMINLLMLAKNGSLHHDATSSNYEDSRFSNIQGAIIKQEVPKREWTSDDLAGQAVGFVIAGFGTPSSLLTFISYELAKHPDIQEKLLAEIDDVYKMTGGKPSFADLQNMKYIDMVISETLRLWPPDPFLERVCVKPYFLPPQNDKSNKMFYIKAKEECIIPIYAIHHDPKYFPDPEKFDPERFSEENKGSIKPFTYIPFGAGPRLCIGARFALMSTKAVLFHVLAHFEFFVTKNTEIPFVLATDTFNMHPKNGLKLGLKRRKMNSLVN